MFGTRATLIPNVVEYSRTDQPVSPNHGTGSPSLINAGLTPSRARELSALGCKVESLNSLASCCCLYGASTFKRFKDLSNHFQLQASCYSKSTSTVWKETLNSKKYCPARGEDRIEFHCLFPLQTPIPLYHSRLYLRLSLSP